MNGNCYSSDGINPTLTCNKNEGNRVAIPVLTPERGTKCQNGRRFKEDGEEAFTLTSQDRHGVAIEVEPEVIGGVGEKNYGKQWRPGNRIYDGEKIAAAIKSQPVGNTGGNTEMYAVEVEPIPAAAMCLQLTKDTSQKNEKSQTASNPEKTEGCHEESKREH